MLLFYTLERIRKLDKFLEAVLSIFIILYEVPGTVDHHNGNLRQTEREVNSDCVTMKDVLMKEQDKRCTVCSTRM